MDKEMSMVDLLNDEEMSMVDLPDDEEKIGECKICGRSVFSDDEAAEIFLDHEGEVDLVVCEHCVRDIG